MRSCQKLAPDWKKVEKQHTKSTLLVGSVDCSDGPAQGGQGGRNPLCDKYKAMSLPTLMYFSQGSKKGFTYEGNKTAADLIAFAEELGSTCSPAKLDECTDAQKGWFEEYGALSVEDLKQKASSLTMEGEMAKFQMMMTQMRMQEAYQKDKVRFFPHSIHTLSYFHTLARSACPRLPSHLLSHLLSRAPYRTSPCRI